jgi:hypothetical protein
MPSVEQPFDRRFRTPRARWNRALSCMHWDHEPTYFSRERRRPAGLWWFFCTNELAGETPALLGRTVHGELAKAAKGLRKYTRSQPHRMVKELALELAFPFFSLRPLRPWREARSAWTPARGNAPDYARSWVHPHLAILPQYDNMLQ